MTTSDARGVVCDVLVVGSGAAGMSTAVAAADQGLDTVVVEREPYLGGTSALSGGWMYVPGNKQGVEEFGDTREEITSYLRELAGEFYDEDRVEAFLETAPEMLDFFEHKTSVEFVYPDLAPDYHMEAPGARAAGRCVYAKPIDARELGDDRTRLSPYLKEITVFGVMPQIGPDLQQFLHANQSVRAFFYVFRRIVRNWAERARYGRGLDLSNGNALIARLVKSAADRGVSLCTSTSVRELVTSNGTVRGALLDTPDGERAVTVRRGIVLACGGFSHNASLRRQLFDHDPKGDAHFSPTNAGNSGDNVRLGTSVGGAFDTTVAQPAAWAPVSVFRGRRGRQRVFPHLRGVGLPGIIAVNRHGRRFTNESNSYHDFGPALVAANSGDDDVYGFLIADARTMHRYGIGYAKPWPVPRLPYRLNGYLFVGRTLEQLARRAGIDPVGLRATVEDFNRHARRGEDPTFQRGLDEFNHFKGDPEHKPNPSLAPVEKGPFYATKIRMGDLGTFAGLAADAHARVLTDAGDVVPGLYAVGSAASSVFGGAYPGHGANLGPAMTFGYLVGRDLGKATPIADPAAPVSPSSA